MMTYDSDKKKENYRILYVTYAPPPIVRGPAILIHRMFRYFPKNSYMVLTHRFQDSTLELDEGLWLPCRYYYTWNIDLPKYLRRFHKLHRKIFDWLQVPLLFMRGMQVLRAESIKHILVHPHSGNFLLAMCFLHLITRIPLSIYFFDMFDLGQGKDWQSRKRALIERLVVPMASNVFVMSEPLKEHYHKKYRIKPVLLPHPVDFSLYNFPYGIEKSKAKRSNSILKIVFTGMVYEAQLDAIINLVKVVNELSNVELHIYAPLTEAKRCWMGIAGHNVVFHGSVSQKDIVGIQQNTDILFLPMAFDYAYPHIIKTMSPKELREQRVAGKEIIKTASPSKLPEYLAASRPILIHAPSFSYVAWYGKTYKCAEVVDRPDLEMLRRAILRLRNDQDHCDYLMANARKALKQHDAVKISKRLQQCLGL
ncbi:MAG: hypothetical protein ACUZ8N_01610 [Candidatus Scalindua sp.]